MCKPFRLFLLNIMNINLTDLKNDVGFDRALNLGVHLNKAPVTVCWIAFHTGLPQHNPIPKTSVVTLLRSASIFIMYTR